MAQEVNTVSELVSSVKGLLEGEFRSISVQGEVTNISQTVAGHYYFNLSDDDAQISCACFRGDVLRNPFVKKIKDGDKIIISGHMSVYLKRGVFQIIVKRAMPMGLGDLKAKFEKLKAKYQQLGYFDADKKKSIPNFPKRIAVITAPYGAALQDFLNVMKRRSLWLDIVIVPAIVQGKDSATSLVSSLKKAQALEGVETIILTRGGGAMEDLWSFNDEKLVEAIHKCEIPIISAVGHQVDFTLCDFVSDMRLETPSAAAEFLSQPQMQIKTKLNELGRRLKVFLYEKQSYMQKKIQRINPLNLLSIIKLNHQKLFSRFDALKLIERKEQLIGIEEAQQGLSDLLEQMLACIQAKIDNNTRTLKQQESMLNSLNPKNVLGRGYTYIKQQNNVIMKKKNLTDQDIDIYFQDGSVKVKRI
jgi:exodeoxyribonuclease VII large subunit